MSAQEPITAFAIKAEIKDARAKTFAFEAQKTMYGGKLVVQGDDIFVFASENEGGVGLVARGVVTAVADTPRRRGPVRQTPRVSLTITRTALAKQPLGRSQLKLFTDWKDARLAMHALILHDSLPASALASPAGCLLPGCWLFKGTIET